MILRKAQKPKDSLHSHLIKELNITKFTADKATTAHFNLEKIKRSRKYITEDETKMLMCPVVLLHLDYGDVTLENLPNQH